MKILSTSFLCSLFFMAFSASVFAKPDPIKPFVVVLDAGHGGKDPGNLGNGYMEKIIALKIALKAGEVPPPIKKVYFWNATGTSKAEVVRGSRSLENYTGISRIPSNNAKQEGRPKGTKYKNKKRRC